VQEIQFEGDKCTLSTAAARPTGVFKDPDGVGLYLRGRRLARLNGKIESRRHGGELDLDVAGELRVDPSIGYIGFKVEELRWEHYSAMMVLQGAHLNTIFEGKFVFVQGRHKPVYDPIPGMTELIFLEVTYGDEKIPPQAYFTHFWEEVLDKEVWWSEEPVLD
jgi:hypothetical protein